MAQRVVILLDRKGIIVTDDSNTRNFIIIIFRKQRKLANKPFHLVARTTEHPELKGSCKDHQV